MDARAVAGKTVFFILICLFVSVFSGVFGQENYQVGVIVIVLALTMLGRDMSVRPWMNLGAMLGSTVAMCLVSYASVCLGNPFIGVVLNFAFVFAVCFVNMRDLNTPLHFPFLLGYAFMLTAPVTAEGLPMRVLSMAIGSFLIVGLNVAFNHGNRKKEKEGVSGICDEVVACCDAVLAGSTPDPSRLERMCSEASRRLYDHLRDHFYSSPGDRAFLDTVVSLEVIGTAVCGRVRDPPVLNGISTVMGSIRSIRGKDADTGPAISEIDSFLREHSGADPEVLAAMRTIRDVMWRMSYRTSDAYDPERPGRSYAFRFLARESFRMDSVRFTFSFRMATMFALCAFIWQYSGMEESKALMFAVIAMIQPYVEDVRRKTALRLAGALAGIAGAILALLVADGDVAIITVILLIVNYAFTLVGQSRYDVMMGFITLSSLLAASMTTPAETVMTERVGFMFLGIAMAFVANHILLPYNIRNENMRLAGRYLDISWRQLLSLADLARGSRDDQADAAITLEARAISAKMGMNVSRDRDVAVERFLVRQSGLTARCRLMSRSVSLAGHECRTRVAEMIGSYDPSKPRNGEVPEAEGLEQEEADIVRSVADILDVYGRDRAIYQRLASA